MNDRDREKKRAKILKKLAEGYSPKRAAMAAGIHRRTLVNWRAEDPEFDEECSEAIEGGTDEVEDIALGQAKKGNGIVTLAILNARRPDKWRRTAKNDADQPPPVNFTLNLGTIHPTVALPQAREGNLLPNRSKG